MAGKGNLQFSVDIDGAEAAARKLNAMFEAARNGAQVLGTDVDKTLGRERQTVIEIRTELDETGAKKAVAYAREVGGAWDQITKYIDNATKAQAGSLTSLRQQVNEAKQARDYVSKYATELIRAEDGTFKLVQKTKLINPEWTAANAKLESLNKQLNIASASNFWERFKADLGIGNFEKIGRTINDLVNTFQSISIIIGQVTSVVNNFINTLGKLQQFDKTFEAIGVSASTAGVAFEGASRIALQYGVALDSVRDGFTKLSPTILQTGGSIEDVSGIVEALSSRFVAFGLSAEQGNRVMNAVIQAFGKGKLMAEELTQQIAEADPAFAVNFAGALGVTTTEFLKMVKAGEITRDVMKEIIPQMKVGAVSMEKFGGDVSKAVDAFDNIKEPIQVTARQIQTLINNVNQLSFERIVTQSKDFVKGLLDVGASIAKFFDALSRSDTVELLSSVFGRLLSIVADVIQIVTKLAQAIDFLIKPITGTIAAIDSWTKNLIGIEVIASLIATAIGIGLVGSIVKMLGVLKDTAVIGTYINLLKDLGVAAGTGLAGSFGVVATGAQKLGDVLKNVTVSAIKGAGETAASKSKDFIKLGEALVGISDQANAYNARMERIKARNAEASGSTLTLSKALEDTQVKAYGLSDSFGKTAVNLDTFSKGTSRLSGEFTSINLGLQSTEKSAVNLSSTTKQLGTDFGVLETNTKKVGVTTKDSSVQLGLFDVNAKKTGQTIGAQGSLFDNYGLSVSRAASSMTNLGDANKYYAQKAGGSIEITRNLGDVLKDNATGADGTAASFDRTSKKAGDLEVSSGRAGGAMSALGGGIVTVGRGIGGLVAGFGLAIAGSVALALAFDTYNNTVKVSNSVTEQLRGNGENLKEKIKQLASGMTEAEASTASYEQQMRQLDASIARAGKSTANFWDVLGTLRDFSTLVSIVNTTKAIGAGLDDVNGAAVVAKRAIDDFAAAGENASKVLEQNTLNAVTAQIAAYKNIIQVSEKARAELLVAIQKAADSRKAVLKAKLEELDAQIEKAKRDLAEFILYAEKNGVKLGIDLDGEALANTLAGFKEFVKKIEGETALITVDDSSFDKSLIKIQGVKLVLENLSKTKFDLNLEIDEAKLQTLKEYSALYQSLSNLTKARGDAEESVAGIIRANMEYQLQKMQEIGEAQRQYSDERIRALGEQNEGIDKVYNAEIQGIENAQARRSSASAISIKSIQNEIDLLRERGGQEEEIAAKQQQLNALTATDNKNREAAEKRIQELKNQSAEQQKANELEIARLRKEEEKRELQRQQDQKDYQRYVKGVEAQLAVARLGAILQQQQAEKAAFVIKQQQEQVERKLTIAKMEQIPIQLKMAELAMQEAKARVEAAKALELQKQGPAGPDQVKIANFDKQIEGYNALILKSQEYTRQQEDINNQYKAQEAIFLQKQAAEAQAFDAQQQAQRNAQIAALASYGLLSGQINNVIKLNGTWQTQVGSIKDAYGNIVPVYETLSNFDPEKPWRQARAQLESFNLGLGGIENKVQTVSAGFIKVGDEVKTVYSGTLLPSVSSVSSAIGTSTSQMNNFGQSTNNAATAATNMQMSVGAAATKADELGSKNVSQPFVDGAKAVSQQVGQVSIANNALTSQDQLVNALIVKYEELTGIRLDTPFIASKEMADEVIGALNQMLQSAGLVNSQPIGDPMQNALGLIGDLALSINGISGQYAAMNAAIISNPFVSAIDSATNLGIKVDETVIKYGGLNAADLTAPYTNLDVAVTGYTALLDGIESRYQFMNAVDLSLPITTATAASTAYNTELGSIVGTQSLINQGKVDLPLDTAISTATAFGQGLTNLSGAYTSLNASDLTAPFLGAINGTVDLGGQIGLLGTGLTGINSQVIHQPFENAQPFVDTFRTDIDLLGADVLDLSAIDISQPYTVAMGTAEQLQSKIVDTGNNMTGLNTINITEPYTFAINANEDLQGDIIDTGNYLSTINDTEITQPLDKAIITAGSYQGELNGVLGLYDTAAAVQIAQPIIDANNQVPAFTGSFSGVISSYQTAEDAQLDQPIIDAAGAITPLNTEIGLVLTEYDEMQNADLKKPVDDTSTAVTSLRGPVGLLNTDFVNTKDEIGKSTDGIIDLGKKIDGVKAKPKLADPMAEAKDSIDSIKRANFKIDFTESATASKIIADRMSKASGSIGSITTSTIVDTSQKFAGYADTVGDKFSIAKTKVDGIVSAIKSLDGFTATVTVQVVKVNSNFAGGPVKAGELTTINELGREAFLTRGGHLSMINKPKNSLWRPPTSGTVIPAHIAQNLDIPTAGVKVNRSAASAVQGMARRDASAPDVARALYAALESSGVISNSRYNATSQAAHAVQIGKLTHAINKLVDKNWDVNVNIKERNTGLGAHRTINRIV